MQHSSIIVLFLLGVVCNIVLAAQLRILAGSNDLKQGAYASILEIDTATNNYTVIRDKIQLYPGRMMMLGTSGTLNGTDCYILAVRGVKNTYQLSLQYFRISDGVMIQQSPETGMIYIYDSILADETKEANILMQGSSGTEGEVFYFVDAVSGQYKKMQYAVDLDFGQYSYLSPPRLFSIDDFLDEVFSHEYTTWGPVETVMKLDCWRRGVDVWGNNREYYVLTPDSLYRCPAVAQTVCSEFINIQVNLTAQFTNKVVRGITFDKAMQKMYFIGDPQTLYTVDVATQTIESQINLSQLFDKYPQLRNLRVYEQ